MEHKDWGHALFLASKMDDRTHNNVMLRFANSLAHNDPLQTLYQLMSGNIPQASHVSCIHSFFVWLSGCIYLVNWLCHLYIFIF